jgi:hypothetical protein
MCYNVFNNLLDVPNKSSPKKCEALPIPCVRVLQDNQKLRVLTNTTSMVGHGIHIIQHPVQPGVVEGGNFCMLLQMLLGCLHCLHHFKPVESHQVELFTQKLDASFWLFNFTCSGATGTYWKQMQCLDKKMFKKYWAIPCTHTNYQAHTHREETRVVELPIPVNCNHGLQLAKC